MSPPPAASQRLAVLSKQLSAGAAPPAEHALPIAAQATRGAGEDEVRPAPGGGKGSLTVLDNRTGKKYTVSVGCARVIWARGCSRRRGLSVAAQGWAHAKTALVAAFAAPPGQCHARWI